jgi:transposase
VDSAERMPRAYDNDLRRKVLAAHAAGKGSQRVLAQWFGVSLGWVEKVCRQQRPSGQAERIEQRHGPVSRVDGAAQSCLLRAIADRPDLTLAELQRILAEQQGVRLCIAQGWNVLKRLGVRLKKSRSTPPSAIPRPTVASGKRSSSASARSRRNT